MNHDLHSSFLMSKTDVSIIIPCYNHGKYLADSIQSCRKQTREPREIIVVDDASPDPETQSILDDLEADDLAIIRLKQNGGVARARNEGIRIASGSMILPLDADDVLEPEFLEEAIPVMNNHPDCGVVYSQGYYFGAEEGIVPIPPYQFPGILLDPYIFSVGLFRKVDWEKAGGYSEEMRDAWEDYEFWISIIELGKTVYQIAKPLIGYRRHEQGSRDNWVNSVERRVELHKRIFELHKEFYCRNIDVLFRNHVENGGLKQAREMLAPREFHPELYRLGEEVENYPADGTVPEREWTTVSFSVDGGWRLEDTLRLDPMNNPGFGKVGTIRLFSGDKAWKEINFTSVAGQAIFHGSYLVRANDGLFFSCGVDPQIWIPWRVLAEGEGGSVDRIEVDLRLEANFFDTLHAMQRTAKVLAKGRYGLVSLEDDVDAYQKQLLEELSRRRMNASGIAYRLGKALEDGIRLLAISAAKVAGKGGRSKAVSEGNKWSIQLSAKSDIQVEIVKETNSELQISVTAPLGSVWVETAKARIMGVPENQGFSQFRFPTEKLDFGRIRYTDSKGVRHTLGWLTRNSES